MEDGGKEFYAKTFRFALSRKAPRDVAEEFPAFAWEGWHVKKWKSTMLQMWKAFVRDQLGSQTSYKSKTLAAIRFRRVYMDREKNLRLDYLENGVAAPESPELIRFPKLPLKDQMIFCLAQSGFSLAEIEEGFDLKNLSSKSSQESLREKLIQAEKWTDRPIWKMGSSEAKFYDALRARQRKARQFYTSLVS